MTNEKLAAELEAMRIPELQKKFAEVTGETTRSPNRKFLVRRIIAETESIEALARKTETQAEDAAPDAAAETKLSKLDLVDLQARYLEAIGRPTTSTNKRYLIWKIQQAAKGRVKVGPKAGRGTGVAADSKVLPVRLPIAVIAPLDEVWRRMGLKSRNEMFRRAMASYLVHVGESDLAGHFGATFAEDRNEVDAA